MGLERRNPLRRKLCGGAVVGAIAALACGAVDALAMAVREGGADAGAPLVGMLVGAGLLLGGVLGVVIALAEPGVDALAQKRRRRPAAAALVYTLCATPVVALLAAQALGAGEGVAARARSVALGLALVGGVYVVMRLVMGAAAALEQQLRRGDGRVGWSITATLALAGVAAGARAAARGLEGERVRAAIELGSLAVMMLAVLAAAYATRAGQRRWARVASPRGAMMVTLAAVSAVALSWSALRAERTREAVARESVVVGALWRE